MQVFDLPDEVPFAEPDYAHYDFDKEQARQQQHIEQLRKWLKDSGYNGPDSGKIVSFPVGDGYAQYMLADAPRGMKSGLIHLPYGDAYQYRDVGFLPKAEILRRIAETAKINAIFSPLTTEKQHDERAD